MNIDLNCDLGEDEPIARTRALFAVITSANVACGGHAGDARLMEKCVLLAKQHGVHLGAHPGVPGSFGRGEVRLDEQGLEMLLAHQVGALAAIASANRVRLSHIKLHGALYHAAENDPVLGKCFLQTVKRWWPALHVFAFAGGKLAASARALGVGVWEEAFLDRGYLANGQLVPRTEPGAILSIEAVQARLTEWLSLCRIADTKGNYLSLYPKTWCVHSDSPDSLEIARLARKFLVRR